ncbi:MAG: type I DNA topoisomerase, partial [Anaerolineae bacterium]|nr:type I DNA topoisomerase [Anaerolineae bacterium]
MSIKLVIVESPAKAKTIAGILGGEYRVLASMGHVRDLPRKTLGVEIEAGFHPQYVTATGKKKTIDQLKKAAESADTLYLATDLDREGEAIGWHVLESLKRTLPRGIPVRRVTFHEITPSAIRTAFEHARSLDHDLIEAQQTRRILDRLVGYTISPLLWRHIRGARGLSAGRVQTAALRLVVDREREIAAFVPEEYWSIEALLQQVMRSDENPLGLAPPAEPVPFWAQLWRIRDPEGRWHKPDLKNRDDTQAIVDALQDAAYWIDKVETERKPRYPWPPFTTSTLQQAASKVLGFAPRLTMSIAQQLYEGVKLGEEGSVGLITYMRTDSTYVAPDAQAAAREVVLKFWGEGYLPERPPEYKTKVKSAQEAHEAIRPTDPRRTPKSIEPYLDDKQFKLYTLIWRRFIASQMKPALYDVTTAEIPTAKERQDDPLPYLFRAQGRVCIFDGFLKVYEEEKDVGEEEEQEQALPPLTAGEWLELLQLLPKQHFTQPPPRYTEASLIKELERRGIGRPSTYAAMVTLIRERDYVRREGKVLMPTELGFAVCDMLVQAFADLFDYGFTAQMEDQLDEIANGRAKRVPTLDVFWKDLAPHVEQAKTEMPTVKIEKEAPQPTGEKCPDCGSDLVRRKGKYGYFVGCANYPKCKYIQKAKREAPQPVGRACPQCGGELVLR